MDHIILDNTEILEEMLCAMKIQEHMIKQVVKERTDISKKRLDAINRTVDQLTAQLINQRVLKAA
tara:strand:- start:201 stop:395 length:195 start_codon:yes stop_codon:yes gene_type:complete